MDKPLFRLEGDEVTALCACLSFPSGIGFGYDNFPATYVFKDGTTCDAREASYFNPLPNGKTPKDIATIIYTKSPGVTIGDEKGIKYLVVILETTAK